MGKGFNARLPGFCRFLLRSVVLTSAPVLLSPTRSSAQASPVDSLKLISADPLRANRTGVCVGAALAVAAAEDSQIDKCMRHHATHSLDVLARDIDPFGRAEYLRPALAAAVVLPLLARKPSLAKSALRVAISYFAADAAESLLKPAVGRHRPDSTERAFRFHPFSSQESWHSFPSAHTTHAFAIADAVAMESGSAWVKDPMFAAATLVGMQRVYKQAHWTSDVVASAALSMVVSRAAERFLRERIR